MFQIGLVGATNVGKSTLFNRLIGQFRAIVTDIPGTTVDILYHEIILNKIGKVKFADSPGLEEFDQERIFIKKIIDESDLILFVIDDTIGITAKEQRIYSYIMESNKRKDVVLVVNKLDVNYNTGELDLAISDYYDFGIENIIGISAKKEFNISQLSDFIEDYFDGKESIQDFDKGKEETPIGIAIIGKPNVGKSTLLNLLVGEELSKVEDYLGTTRDYITGEFTFQNKRYKVYDTVGLRKKGSIHGIEKIAYDKVKGMLEYARPAIVFMIDAEQGVTHRDMTLLAEINNLALPITVVVNKMDLLDSKQKKFIEKKVQAHLDYAKYIPIIPIVAKEGKGVKDMLGVVSKIFAEATKRIDTNELNKVISKDMIKRPPRFPKNKICKLYYITQVDINAPTFVAFVNKKDRANFAFKKWIENTIRQSFGFVGTPIVIRFKERNSERE
ncbi:MAG TPA: ribosome biogenesis GTPase Der [Candidatus Absconditabacterales bacterium]|nr:ribosome biogenesis GTPase Der [Candidatus Absconditabacterales bacterium]